MTLSLYSAKVFTGVWPLIVVTCVTMRGGRALKETNDGLINNICILKTK